VPATLESNLSDTREALACAAREVGRDPGTVTLLAVTKSVGPRTTEALVRLGQTELGENRLESLLPKRESLATAGLPVTWHFIGHVQRKKARKVLRNAEVIHSVDTPRLIETLERIAVEERRRPAIYLEVELTGEEHRHGFTADELPEAILLAGAAEHLALVGLMTMAPLPAPGEDAEQSARGTFETLARLARRYRDDSRLSSCFEAGEIHLSMGMSGDYRAAIACGSDLVRIGSALFEGIATDERIQGVKR